MLVMSTGNTPARSPRGSLAVLVGLLVLWLAWLGWFLLAPDRNADGRCAGLGFGCTLTPRDVAVFAGIILVAPLSVLVGVVTGVVRLVRVVRVAAVRLVLADALALVLDDARALRDAAGGEGAAAGDRRMAQGERTRGHRTRHGGRRRCWRSLVGRERRATRAVARRGAEPGET